MQRRTLGPFDVSAIGFGCMSLSHGYGPGPDEDSATRLLNQALDAGHTLLDTAALYGFGQNESLLGEAVMHRRDEFVLTSKCGIFRNEAGKREINGRPEVLRKTCEDSLRRLNTDTIDLYYLHRWDKQVPIEESVGALGDLVRAGKVRALGLSEVSAKTLHRAHAEHPISAVQSEYSLWTREPEIAVLQACKDIGAAFVAFSPLARGFLTGQLTDPQQLADSDLRRSMPRFSEQNYPANLALLHEYQRIARQTECSMAQLALAWLLARSDHIIPIPGTSNAGHLIENSQSAEVVLSQESMDRLEELINQHRVRGARYNDATLLEVDTETF
ncbi:aldo/keto reductase [Marinobacterium sedimentorum]|uniref:aldo/keto reductase n=1 Tax=Marinobacterium sedimentorum TaxID=2927804 RepID=UPI0020C6FAEB|nr:aldo/keto reductase [Marinobacterium sedimentorum]MCP8687058.1 aldo/keto reductase [Marinobacterium sedimentorum]